TLDDPSATGGTVAAGINGSGLIVGYYTGAGVNHGFLLNHNTFTYTTLDHPLGVHGTVANGINIFGQIVGTYADSNFVQHGFLYSGGTYITLDDPLATGATLAFRLDDSRQIVCGYNNAAGPTASLLIIPPTPPPPAGTTADMILRRADGTYEIYDIGNNAILAGYELGHVGTDWKFIGLGGFFGSDTTDMLLRNSS